MAVSLYTQIGKIIKKCTGISDISKFKKDMNKRLGKLIYKKKYGVEDVVKVMQELGLKKGSVVCIHSAMKEFYNYKDTAKDLIDKILETIGPEGTLLMPAFPDTKLTKNPDYVFDRKNDKTGAGYLAETFRKYPGVKRSINVRHSVCVIGKYADYLIKDHHHCENCWDENSPWYRMTQLDALVFNLGLPRSYMGTFHHCVESILRNRHPYFAQFFNKPTTFKYYDNDGKIAEYKSIESNLERRTRKKKITKFFTNKEWKISKISNLEIKVFYSKNALSKMINLGLKGITVYYVPNPKKFTYEA